MISRTCLGYVVATHEIEYVAVSHCMAGASRLLKYVGLVQFSP